MVRFIMLLLQTIRTYTNEFTFQYGQIYYCQLCTLPLLFSFHLHSNMVRFIIYRTLLSISIASAFTFQYGQIYYFPTANSLLNPAAIYIPIWLDLLSSSAPVIGCMPKIYIPIWLDLLYINNRKDMRWRQNLHSNMVRFIIQNKLKYIMCGE